MSVFNIFSKRQRQLRGDVPDVYSYDALPQSLRVQIVHIWRGTLGDEREIDHVPGVHRAYQLIVETLCREYGVFELPCTKNYSGRNYFVELVNFLLQVEEAEKALDSIELSFKYIDRITRSPGYRYQNDASELADAAIQELHTRFREHGVGYQFVDDEIVRVDSEFLHVEAVKPALTLLHTRDHAGAQQEFLAAYEHYRHGRAKEALVEALKALESVMKVICAKHVWAHDPNAPCSALIKVLFDHDLIPPFWAGHFSALRSTLEAGVPTARNRVAGHGQGADVVEVPPHIVGYVLHMAASAIVFLVEAERTMR